MVSARRGVSLSRAGRELTRQRLELRTLSFLPRTQPHFMSIRYNELPWAPVTAFRQAGNPVITWTIRSPDQEAMARRQSDQITFERYRA